MLNSRKWMMDVEVMVDGMVKINILWQKNLKLEVECAAIDMYVSDSGNFSHLIDASLTLSSRDFMTNSTRPK